MCALFLSKNGSHKENFSDKMIVYLHRKYQPLLEKAIKIKYWLVAGTLAIFVISLMVFKNLGGEFIPQLQEGDYAFHCILPQGSSLSQSVETSKQASRIIKRFDEVEMVVGKTGAAEVPTDPMPPEASDLIIVLKPKSEWKSKKSYEELSNEILEKLEIIPGVFFESNQPIQMRFNELMTGVRQDVAVKIFGENLDSLAIYADKVGKVIQTVKGATAPQIEKVDGLPQINVEYDRTKMANYGLNVEDVNTVLSTAFAGKTAGQVYENERRFDLVVRLDSANRNDITDVQNLLVSTNSGNQIPLSQIAKIDYKLGPAQISREAGKRRIYVGFNVQDRDVQSVVAEIQEKLDAQVKLPTGYYFTYGGQFENLEKASARLLVAVPISLLLIFLLLYFTFNSIKQALLIFTAIPMSAIGGILALLIRDMPFSISAGIGFIALFGVAVLNGIVLIGTFNQLKKDGVTDILQRVFEGTKERLRPVLMTATVASVGFLPMALSHGAGAEVQKPLATVVIGGLMTATFLTLFVLPLLYIIFEKKMKFKIKKSKPVVLIFLFLLTSFGSMLHAQTRTISSVEEAIQIGIENNSTLKANQLEVESTKSLLKTANEIPKLEFSAELGQYNGPKFDQAFSISQTIPFPTLFGAKKNLINAEIKSGEIQGEISAMELKSRIRTYYYQIEYLLHNRKQLLYVENLYTEFIRVAKLRYKVGDIKKVEVSTAEVKKGEVHLLFQQNEVYLKNAYQSLQALTNSSEAFEIQDNENYKPLQFEGLMTENLIENHPSLKLLNQNVLISEQNKLVEKAKSLPDLTFGITNQSLIGFFDVNGQEKYFGSGNRFTSVNIGVSIPLFSATKSKIEALNFTQKSTQAKAEQQKRELNAELQNKYSQYQHDVEEYQYYVNEALPNAKDIIFAAELGYRVGEISYVEYLFALETASDIQLKYLKSIEQVNQSVIGIYSVINQ